MSTMLRLTQIFFIVQANTEKKKNQLCKKLAGYAYIEYNAPV